MLRDGEQDTDVHSKGPELLQFLDTSLKDVDERAMLCWKKILDAKIPIPLSAVHTYNHDGSALNVTIMPRAEEIGSDSTQLHNHLSYEALKLGEFLVLFLLQQQAVRLVLITGMPCGAHRFVRLLALLHQLFYGSKVCPVLKLKNTVHMKRKLHRRRKQS